MRDVRIYHPEPLADDTEFTLADTARAHVGRVLRLKAGAALVLFDGTGAEWPATLVDAPLGTVRTRAGVARNVESPLALTLVQGISRGERMDWTVQKAVELGVQHIRPVTAERSAVRLDAARATKRHAHWTGVVIASCEQCGRTQLPRIDPPMSLEGVLRDSAGTILVLDPDAATTLPAVAPDRSGGITLLVGPEGGFSAAELEAVDAAGGTRLRLGPRVLRTETAGVAAIAALQALYGDLSG